ncbi:MAG: GPW/gp25 family protein [Blautia sp.]|nr:GPW/gp25 family protein [Blautia sp.]
MEERTDGADFLGCGVAFPPRTDPLTGRFLMCRGEEDIAEAIRLILFTVPGERVMQPEFGCGIKKYAFSSMSMIDRRGMEKEIRQALLRWEPRIKEVEVRVTDGRLSEGIADICISYEVRATNNPYNLVFPYYIHEGA